MRSVPERERSHVIFHGIQLTGADLGHFANTGFEDFTQWLPKPDFQFDPNLFGDYRDPQESLSLQGFDDTFFQDALDVDFTTPYNLPITTPIAGKKDLIAQIDAAKEDDEPAVEAAVGGQMLNCNKVWYVRSALFVVLRGSANFFSGKGFKAAPRYKAAISTSTASAPICRRRQSATATRPWSTRRISTASSRSICPAPRTRSRPRPMYCPCEWAARPRRCCIFCTTGKVSQRTRVGRRSLFLGCFSLLKALEFVYGVMKTYWTMGDKNGGGAFAKLSWTREWRGPRVPVTVESLSLYGMEREGMEFWDIPI